MKVGGFLQGPPPEAFHCLNHLPVKLLIWGDQSDFHIELGNHRFPRASPWPCVAVAIQQQGKEELGIVVGL